MSDTTKRILEHIKQITSDDFDHIEKNIKYIKEEIQSAIVKIDRIWEGYTTKKEIDIQTHDDEPYSRDKEHFLDGVIQVNEDGKLIDEETTAKKLLEEIKRPFDLIHKENIIDKIDDYRLLLNCNYKLFKIKNINKQAIVHVVSKYNSHIYNIITTFEKIREEICKINKDIKKNHIIKIDLKTIQITNESETKINKIIETLIDVNKIRLANYLFLLSSKNTIDTEITFNLEDLKNICKWLASENDEEMKLKLDDNSKGDLQEKIVNAIKIQTKIENKKQKTNKTQKQKTNKTHITIIEQKYKIENLKKAKQTQVKTEPKKPPSKKDILDKIRSEKSYKQEILNDICTIEFKLQKKRQCEKLITLKNYLNYFIESKFKDTKKDIEEDDIENVRTYYMHFNYETPKGSATEKKKKKENIINNIINEIKYDIDKYKDVNTLLEKIIERVKEIKQYKKDLIARKKNLKIPERISEIDCIELRF